MAEERMTTAEWEQSACCDRCSIPVLGSLDLEEWSLTLREGVIVGVLCPRCQTDAETMEGRVNEAMLEHYRLLDGRILLRPKGGN